MVDFELHWGLRPPIISYNDKIVLDLGADYGSTAEFFLNHGAKKVIAVEGDSKLSKQLIENYKGSSNVIPISQFIDSPKHITMFVLEHKPDIVKVDIEGYELHLLKVKPKVIQSVKEWMIEYHSDELKDKLIKFFQSLHYIHTRIPYMCSGKWWVSHFTLTNPHRRKVLEWVSKHGRNVKGYVLHVGSGIDKYKMERFFPKATTYRTLDRFQRENVDLVADIQNMPNINSELADCILATEMMYIVPNTNMALKELYRVLKKSGVLIISFLTEGYPHPKLADESHRFTREEVEAFLENNKFMIDNIDECESNILVVAKKCC